MEKEVLARAILAIASSYSNDNAVTYLKEVGISEKTIDWIIAGDIDLWESFDGDKDKEVAHVIKHLCEAFERKA